MKNFRVRAVIAGAGAVALAMAGSAGIALAASSAAAAPGEATCKPGSGPNLAGKTLTASQISGFDSGKLQCANLTGANLAGLSMGQINMSGAILKNAHMSGADLIQATLVGADLSGADLTHAKLGQADMTGAKLVGANLEHADLGQATMKGVDLTGADLSGASLIQADLTDAKLDHSKLGGADFTQATLDKATFNGATGMPPWTLYLMLGAAAIFVLLVLFTILRAVRAMAQGVFSPVRLVVALIGCAVVAIGLHLFVGGLAGQILSAAGPPITQMCKGVQCTVGVSSGFIGIFGGVILALAGFAMRATLRVRPSLGNFGQPGMPGMPGPGQMDVPGWKSF